MYSNGITVVAENRITITMTVRDPADFDIQFSQCDVHNDPTCTSVFNWSSTAALDFDAFVYMDNAFGVELPALTAPTDAFDSDKYYHDLHVVPASAYTGCDSSCWTSDIYKVDSSHTFIELEKDLNELTLEEEPTMNVKADVTDRNLIGIYYAVWVIKDATILTNVLESQAWQFEIQDPC